MKNINMDSKKELIAKKIITSELLDRNLELAKITKAIYEITEEAYLDIVQKKLEIYNEQIRRLTMLSNDKLNSLSEKEIDYIRKKYMEMNQKV